MEFFIVDPHFFICCSSGQKSPTRDTALRFLDRMVKWAKVVDSEDREIGLSNDCIEFLKRYPSSILNGKFLSELREICRTYIPQEADILLLKLIQTLKTKLSFAEALRAIDPNALYYEGQVTIAPGQFESRLPPELRFVFLEMLGNLTFARAQRSFPIAAFENVYFLTTANTEEQRTWMQEKLLICLHAEYVVNGIEDPCLPRRIHDEIYIIHDPSLIAPPPSKPTVRDAIYSAVNRTNGDVVISRELEVQLKKQGNRCDPAIAAKIEKVVCALAVVWLREYTTKRAERYSHTEACELARQAFRQAISCDITDESDPVHQNPKLSKSRIVQYSGEWIDTFLHVKISPRIYFGVRTEKVNGQKTKYTIVLGRIGHLETARYSASSTA